MSKVLFTSYTQDDFKKEMKDVFEDILGRKLGDCTIGGCIDGEEFSLSDFQKPKKSIENAPREKYLTRGEVARFLKISLPTLHRYTKDSILKSYRIGGKVRYKLEEVENALKERNFDMSNEKNSHE